MATVTLKGFEAIARFLAGVSPLSAFTYLSTGSGTTIGEYQENTALETEHTGSGLGRAAAICEYIGPNKIRWFHKYTVSAETTVSEAGVFNSGTTGAGDMFLRHVLPVPISLYSGDELEVIFIHTMTR